jgi:PAS domain S-box-containing protein
MGEGAMGTVRKPHEAARASGDDIADLFDAPAHVAVLDDVVVRGVLDASPDALVVCDGDGRIRFASSQVETLFGADRASLVGESIDELLPERFRGAHRRHRAAYRQRPTTRAMGDGAELFGRRIDGTEFPVEIALSPLVVDDTVFTIATVRDITARRAREAAERNVKRSLDLARDGIVLVDLGTGKVVYANDGFCDLTDYTLDELAELPVVDLCPTLSPETLAAMLAPLLDGRQVSTVITSPLRRRGGGDVTVEALIQCPADEHGVRHHFIAVVRDVDERIRRDSALHRAHEALALAEERERIARDLHDNAIQRLFAGGLALASTCAQVPPAVAAQVEKVIDQLDDTIRDLRNAVFGLGTTRDHDIDLGTELHHVCDDAARILGRSPVLAIIGPIDEAPSTVRPHLVAALREALSNIARHARATTVTVEITMTDRLVMIITDDGIGLPPGGVTTPGSGLRNLADRARSLGGTFDLTSEPGRGTVLSWSAAL